MKKNLSKIGLIFYWLGVLNLRENKLIVWNPITIIIILFSIFYCLILGTIEVLEDIKEQITLKIR